MDPGTDLLEVVGALHDGVATPDGWTRSLGKLAGLFGAGSLLLGAVDSRKVGFELVGYGVAPATLDLINGPFANPIDNPWSAIVPVFPLRQPVTVEDIGGKPNLQASRIWEVYEALGIDESVGAVLERQPERAEIAMMGFSRGRDMLTKREVAIFGLLLPHLARAWRTRQMLLNLEQQLASMAAVLDRLDRAIVIAGPQGQLRYANRAADRLLSENDGIDATRGQIRARRPKDTEALQHLVHRASRTGVGEASSAVDAIALPRDPEKPPLAVVAEPLASSHGAHLGQTSEGGAILFIGESSRCTRPEPSRIRTVYALTAAEADLAALIAEGHAVPAICRMTATSANTVRFHLKSIFQKVGVSRQADLVRRILIDVGGLAEPEKLAP